MMIKWLKTNGVVLSALVLGAIGAYNFIVSPIEEGFAEVDDKFDKIDDKFDRIDAKFDRMDAKFDKINDRFDRMDAKFDKKIDGIHIKIDTLVAERNINVENRLTRLEAKSKY